MSSTKRKEKSQPPTPPQWKGRDSMELAHQLNERGLTLLQEHRAGDREIWFGLDADAIRRAARLPFLVVDVHFIDEPWWRSALLNPTATVEEPSSSPWSAEAAEKLDG